jgi:ketosteroid isomerase-like protein
VKKNRSVEGNADPKRGLGQASAAAIEDIPAQIITREKASYEWERGDGSFWDDFLTDETTYFGPDSPYLETDPKVNFVPKFEQYSEVFKLLDFQMYNTRVQVNGGVAILTYNLAQVHSLGGRMSISTGKVSRVYIKQDGRWRAVHTHESKNP